MTTGLNRLFRLRLSLMNGVAAAAGGLLFTGGRQANGVWTVALGVVLLAAGASALNQVMERREDRLMARTRQRPVARGSMHPAAAVLIGTVTALAGCAVTASGGGIRAALLGAGGVIWYLALYTPLKRRTPFALLPGAACGALPPVVGWAGAGGPVADHRIILVAGLVFLWQIPHFWLYQRRHAADYRAAGFPLLDAVTAPAHLPGLFMVWLTSLAAATLLLPLVGIAPSGNPAWYPLLCLPPALLALRNERILFTCLNLFPLLLLLPLLID